jgi:hypothetical protein
LFQVFHILTLNDFLVITIEHDDPHAMVFHVLDTLACHSRIAILDSHIYNLDASIRDPPATPSLGRISYDAWLKCGKKDRIIKLSVV